MYTENRKGYKFELEKVGDTHTILFMKLVSIVIPTNKPIDVWLPLLRCIAQQTYHYLECVIVLDRSITGREFDHVSKHVHSVLDQTHIIVSIVSSYNTSFISGRGASYVRNYGSDVAQGYYVQYMDDDGLREADYIERMVDRYEYLSSVIDKDLIMSPTIMYRDTGQIQSQGFDAIWWGICRPQPHYATDYKSRLARLFLDKNDIFYPTGSGRGGELMDHSFFVSCIGAMGLFAPRALFQVIRFDERFEFVYEDLDMTLRASSSGVPVLVCGDIQVIHMETPRSIAQRSYVGDPRMVYLKSRNRVLFVSNNAPWRGKLLFYLVGLPIHIFWFMMLIGLYGSSRLQSWWMLRKGTWDAIVIHKYGK